MHIKISCHLKIIISRNRENILITQGLSLSAPLTCLGSSTAVSTFAARLPGCQQRKSLIVLLLFPTSSGFLKDHPLGQQLNQSLEQKANNEFYFNAILKWFNLDPILKFLNEILEQMDSFAWNFTLGGWKARNKEKAGNSEVLGSTKNLY